MLGNNLGIPETTHTKILSAVETIVIEVVNNAWQSEDPSFGRE
jgi:hypothetical protein